MSRIECLHVHYCDRCDRYYCAACGCACERGTKPATRVDHERLCPECHGMGRAVESAAGGRLVTLPCVACHGAGYVDDREAWSGQDVVPGVRRAYLTALEDVAKAARGHSPTALIAALDALDRAAASDHARREETETGGGDRNS